MLNPNPHTVVADRLAALHRQTRSTQIELSHQETDLAARILAITPEGGWAGKNEGERKTAKDLAIAADDVSRLITGNITGLRDSLADTEGQIDALREQRDALRWTATAKLADAFEAKYVGRKQIAQAEAIDEAISEVLAADTGAPVTDYVRYYESEHTAPVDEYEPEAGLLPEEESLPF